MIEIQRYIAISIGTNNMSHYIIIDNIDNCTWVRTIVPQPCFDSELARTLQFTVIRVLSIQIHIIHINITGKFCS